MVTSNPILIDPEFRSLLPDLSPDELSKLEANIIRDGCREPIMLWNGFIADGHNRYEICTRNSLGYQVNYLDIEERDDVLLWMLENQGGRRNLSDVDRIAIQSKREDIIARRAKENQIRKPESVSPISAKQTEPIHTREIAAKAAGVGKTKYDEGKVILKAVESGEAPKELLDKVRSGEVSIHKAATEIKAARKPPEPEEWSAESQAAAAEAEKDSEKLWLLKSTWRTASKKDRALFIAGISQSDSALTRKKVQQAVDAAETLPPEVINDPWHHWDTAKRDLDRACRLDKEVTCRRLLEYTKQKLGREFRTREGESIASEVTSHLNLITRHDDDFLEAMVAVIEYCCQRIGDHQLDVEKLGSRTTSPKFSKAMEHTCYHLMGMIRPENPRARDAFEMLRVQCEVHLERLAPETLNTAYGEEGA